MDSSLGLLQHPHNVTEGVIHKRASHNVSYELTSEVTICHFHNTLLVIKVRPTECGWGLHTDWIARSLESLGAILDIGCDRVYGLYK